MHSPFIGTPTKALALGLALAGGLVVSSTHTAQAVERPVLADLDRGGTELFKEIIPSVIQIYTGSSAGSGYFIDKGGYAITNRHVTGGNNGLGYFEITLNDGVDIQERWKATTVGHDPALDFALLKVEAPPEKIVPMKLADTDLMEVGDTVATCGSPGGQRGATNTSDTRDGWLDYFNFNLGVLTEIIPMDRCLIVMGDIYQHEQYADIYQLDYGTAVQYLYHVDAAINKGNSGGPCVNSKGEAVGTNTWGYGGENHGMSVPVNLLTRSAREILQYGRVMRPWLGISLHNPNPTAREQKDASKGLAKLPYFPLDPTPDRMVIQAVNSYSPAGGVLRKGDVILAVDGQPHDNIFDIYKYILNKYPGDKITLHIERGGVGLPPITLSLAEKKNRFDRTHITAMGSGRNVGSYGQTGIGSGVVGVTY